MKVEPITKRLAAETVVAFHYLHRRPPISFAFGLFDDAGQLVGVITFGTPASRHLVIGVLPHEPERVIELNRLWVSDSMPRNTESWFVARALKLLPCLIVVSYADSSFGHKGYVYRASNFFYAGFTDMDRKTPRFDYIVPGKHTRDAFRGGLAQYTERVRRKPKYKYWTVTRGKDQKRLRLACQWPKLDWHSCYPSL